MTILLHDFAGYPYPLDLSRGLARRGHSVRHVYCDSLTTTPGGALTLRSDDPPGLEITPVRLDRPLEKYRFVTRYRQENEVGRRTARVLNEHRPDIVVSANAPLDTQRQLLHTARALDIPFVFWVQDLIGIAAERILKQKVPVIGGVVGRHYRRLEARLLRASSASVVLTDDFLPILSGWGVPDSDVFVVENWAPVESLPMAATPTPWAVEHGLDGLRCLVYAGTLGMKHNPAMLVELAAGLSDRPGVRVVVVSTGIGAEWLIAEKKRRGLDNLSVLPFAPFERMPEVLASAEVLVGLLEPDAGVFSVPSKVLAYLCGGRPVLLSVPTDNLIARIVRRERAGVVVDPGNVSAFVEAAVSLLDEPDRRDRMGKRGRAYAETAFAIDGIAARFDEILQTVARRD